MPCLWAVLRRHAVAADQVESSQTRLNPGYRSGSGTRLQTPRVAKYPGCVCMWCSGMETLGVGWLQLPLIYSVIAVITGNYRASGGNKELLLLRDYPSKTPGRAVTGNYRNSTGIPVTEESVTTRQAFGAVSVASYNTTRAQPVGELVEALQPVHQLVDPTSW